MSPSHPAPAVPGPPPWGPPGPAALDQPQYDATAGQAVARFWRKYTVFAGRASRSEFWWWYLVSFAVSAALGVVGLLVAGDPVTDPADFSLLDAQVLVPQVWSVLTFVGMVALSVRRLHDSNRSGWWYLLTLPGVVSSVLVLSSSRGSSRSSWPWATSARWPSDPWSWAWPPRSRGWCAPSC